MTGNGGPGPVTLRANSLNNGSTLPSTCAPGDCFVKQAVEAKAEYVCLSANTWTGPFDTSADVGDSLGRGLQPITPSIALTPLQAKLLQTLW
jgi:hypothetical protein